MAVVFGRLEVLGDVGEVVEVVSVLTRAEDVPDLMFTHHLLQTHGGGHGSHSIIYNVLLALGL